MTKAIPFTASTVLLLPERNNDFEQAALCAGSGANATLEVFDGTFGTIATFTIDDGGTGYEALDVLTLEQAASGEQATIRVDTVDVDGIIQTATLLSGGTGYAVSGVYSVTGGAGNDDAVFSVDTITDAGALISKLAAVTSESAPPHYLCSLTTHGISVRISGTNAKGHIYYE